jgi:type VI secretion system ImpM family protein
MSADALTRAMLEHPALFGKLPGHGDFISRGVPGELRAAIDLWLSDWLAAARAAKGESFIAAYEAAAPWLLESAEATAVLMPSIDAVGRHFPLLALTAPGCATQQVYDAMVDAISDGRDSDSLREALAALFEGAPEGERSGRWFLPAGATPDLPAPDSVVSWRSVEGCFV